MRALIIEDDTTSRIILKTFLSRHGSCDVAANGTDGLAAYNAALEEGNPYDLICLDIRMPGMDGHMVLRQIRKQEKAANVEPGDGVKIVIITGQDDMNNLAAALHEKCDAYLLKPLDPGKLLEHLKTFGVVG